MFSGFGSKRGLMGAAAAVAAAGMLVAAAPARADHGHDRGRGGDWHHHDGGWGGLRFGISLFDSDYYGSGFGLSVGNRYGFINYRTSSPYYYPYSYSPYYRPTVIYREPVYPVYTYPQPVVIQQPAPVVVNPPVYVSTPAPAPAEPPNQVGTAPGDSGPATSPPPQPVQMTAAPSAPSAPSANSANSQAGTYQDRELGDAYLHMGDFQNAERVYKRYLTAWDKDGTALCNLGMAMIAQGEVQDGFRKIVDGYKAEPALFQRPLSAQDVGGDNSLSKLLDAATRAASGNNTAEGWFTIALLQKMSGHKEQALAATQKAKDAGLETDLLDKLTLETSR